MLRKHSREDQKPLASAEIDGKGRKSRQPCERKFSGVARPAISLLLPTLSSCLSVIQKFCVLPLYLQQFLRSTIRTRE